MNGNIKSSTGLKVLGVTVVLPAVLVIAVLTGVWTSAATLSNLTSRVLAAEVSNTKGEKLHAASRSNLEEHDNRIQALESVITITLPEMKRAQVKFEKKFEKTIQNIQTERKEDQREILAKLESNVKELEALIRSQRGCP